MEVEAESVDLRCVPMQCSMAGVCICNMCRVVLLPLLQTPMLTHEHKPDGMLSICMICGERELIAAGRCSPLNDSNYAWASVTSMAVPHVAGAAAIYLSQNPNATPAQVSHAITSTSSVGLLSTDGLLPGTPNRLLFVDPNNL